MGSVIRAGITRLLRVGILFVAAWNLAACKENSTVVIYTSVDRHFAEPILQAFEDETGIKVEALYDVEAAKTTGLVNKLIAEADRPRADVFWNGEFLQTQLLAQRGLLTAYATDGQQDQQHLWTAFGGRARVLIVNTTTLPQDQWPDSLADFLADRWPGNQMAIAHPLFGTSATHAAALYAAWGDAHAADFYRSAQARGVRIVDGNSVVRDLAVKGEIMFGLTDTDDACSALENGEEVAVVFPDQSDGAIGTLVIPNTVAMIAGAPHPENGKLFVDYLLGENIALELAEAGWFHVNGTDVLTASCNLPDQITVMQVDTAALYEALARIKLELRDILVR